MIIVSVRDSAKEVALQSELKELAVDYLTAALTTPIGLRDGPADETLSKRATWVKRHIVKPTKLLLDALSDDNAPNRSEWPDPMNAPAPNRDVLITELTKLFRRGEELLNTLNDRAGTDANHTTEFQIDFVAALAQIFKRYFPHLPISRGTYDAEQRAMMSKFVEFVKACASEIFPNDPAPSNYTIEHAIK